MTPLTFRRSLPLVGRAAAALRTLSARALLCLLLSGAGPALGQSDAPRSSAQFQVTIEAVARALDAAAANPDTLSEQQRTAMAEFIAGNTLFALCHEMAHAVITEMGLPVLGREEDAADAFATLGMLQLASAFSYRVLAEAANGWFLSDWRKRNEGVKLAFYDEHGLDQQRAYQIVCLMVGSDPDRFKELAEQTRLPEQRQGTCAGDYSNASWSWDRELAPHRRAPEQAKTRIEVLYGEASGALGAYARAFRSIRLLEAVADHVTDQFVWRGPITLDMQSCGDPGTRWDLAARRLTICYEMADDFARLYRDYARKRISLAAMLPIPPRLLLSFTLALGAGLILGYGAAWFGHHRSRGRA